MRMRSHVSSRYLEGVGAAERPPQRRLDAGQVVELFGRVSPIRLQSL